MTLQERINKLITEQSLNHNLSFDKARHFAERGCYIVYRKTIIELLSNFHFNTLEDSLIDDVISVCIRGGLLEKIADEKRN